MLDTEPVAARIGQQTTAACDAVATVNVIAVPRTDLRIDYVGFDELSAL